MSLHRKIMNIPCPYAITLAEEKEQPELALYYRMGHKDARHSAAEMVMKADHALDQIEDSLKELMEVFDVKSPLHTRLERMMELVQYGKGSTNI
jgi:hypothetical protein